jgi:phospho-N-acetylmuramoyl-pentapeptide-transferase
MIPWIAQALLPWFGPFRLFTSRLLLIGLGACLSALLIWLLLPRLWHLLPRDHGRTDAVAAAQSVGKPVGAGLIIMLVYAVVCLLVLPLEARALELLGCALLATAGGFLDDKSRTGWSEYRLGLLDLIVSVLGAAALCQLSPVLMWLPVLKAPLIVSPWIYIPVATALIWITINATNCTDGVDGLSGSLVLVALFYLGIILYGILGNSVIARYLEVPHYTEAVVYGMMSLVMAGALAGYLWHNAHPSAVLMGDAGSRPLGFLLGALVLGSGNPVLLIVVAGVVFVNGATGLLKMALLRFFKIGIFRTVRYPLHDHARQRLGWSNTQVLLRFVLLQALGTPLLLMLVLKVR